MSRKKETFEEFHRRMQSENFFTPDAPELNLWEKQWVFVYGTLKKDCERGSVLKGQDFVGTFRTATPDYLMKYAKGKISGTGYPVALKHWIGVANTVKNYEKGYLMGEMYNVSPGTIARLDAIEGNGYLYRREYVGFKHMEDSLNIYPALCYLGLPSEFPTDTLDDTRILGYRSTKLGGKKMYHFTRP
jgi:gamma-glutamylcyclotransferase (GGCT)/AIG2-like uncharacterized protein YtfP